MNDFPLWKRPVFYYVALVGLGMVLTRFFNFVLLEWLTIYVIPLVWLALLGLGLIGLVWAIIFWARSPRSGQSPGWQRSIPLLLLLGMFGLAIAIPFENLWLTFNFHRYREARQQVVDLMATQQIASNPGIMELPESYRATTLGDGEVEVFYANDSRYVLFFTLRLFEGAAGFIYSENGTPLPAEIVSGYEILEQYEMGDRWYFVRLGG